MPYTFTVYDIKSDSWYLAFVDLEMEVTWLVSCHCFAGHKIDALQLVLEGAERHDYKTMSTPPSPQACVMRRG